MGRILSEFYQRLKRLLAGSDDVVTYFNDPALLAGQRAGDFDESSFRIEDSQHPAILQYRAHLIGKELFECVHHCLSDIPNLG